MTTKNLLVSKMYLALKLHKMVNAGDSVLVGVSGGPDSCALLLALLSLRDKFSLTLRVAHVNHRLRVPFCDEDERFVRDLASRYGVPFHRKRIRMADQAAQEGENLEALARRERYEFFHRLAKRYRCRAIATAHTLDDQAETVLHHIVRSTGIEGLSGIAPVWIYRGCRVIRPMLEVTRKEVMEFLAERKQPFRLDESNLDLTLTRNYLRHEIIPRLQLINPQICQALARLAHIARAECETWEKQETDWLRRHSTRSGDEIVVCRRAFCDLPVAEQRRLVRRTLSEVAPDLQVTLGTVESVCRLAHSRAGRGRRVLRGHAVIARRSDQLIFSGWDCATRLKRIGSRRPSG